jgi:hypothetical protein
MNSTGSMQHFTNLGHKGTTKNAYLQAKLHESLLSSAILFALNLQMCNFCSNFAARLHDSSQP